MNKVNLLVLDDDLFIRRILSDLFSAEYEVNTASSVAEFRSSMTRHSPDIVLIDVLLPDGNGIDLCREVRNSPAGKNIFIIMLTSFDDNSMIENAYRFGANDYIRKPFIPFEISSKVALIAKNIEYQKTVIGLYERQKDINKKLFALASIINTNIHLTNKYGMITSLFQITGFVDAGYIEVVFFDEEQKVISNKKTIKEGFVPLEYKRISAKVPIFSNSRIGHQAIKLKTPQGDTIYCSISTLYFNKQHVGFVILQNSIPFPKEPLDLLSLYLDFVNIKGSDIYAHEQLRDEIRKDRKELAKVRTIQVSLLPHFQELDKYDIASSFIPMEEISGDFFDGFYVKDGVYQIIVCDVAGHGVASSYVGSSIRGIIRSVSKEITDPKELIEYINVSVVRSMKNIYYFSSLVICQLEVATGKISMVAAGHPPCLFYDKSENSVSRVENTGPLLGLTAESTFGVQEMTIADGDCLFIYTDGVTEAANAKSELYGLSKLMEVFGSCTENPSIDIVHSVIGSVYEYTEYNTLQDDVSLICIKKKNY